MLCGEPDIFVTAPDQPGLSGKRKGRRVAEMVRIGADMRRAVRGVRGEPLADAPRLFGAVAIGSVEQGTPVPAGIEIGRETCGERECQFVWQPVVAVTL